MDLLLQRLRTCRGQIEWYETWRTALILQARREGVPRPVLAEASGISERTISRLSEADIDSALSGRVAGALRGPSRHRSTVSTMVLSPEMEARVTKAEEALAEATGNLGNVLGDVRDAQDALHALRPEPTLRYGRYGR